MDFLFFQLIFIADFGVSIFELRFVSFSLRPPPYIFI